MNHQNLRPQNIGSQARIERSFIWSEHRFPRPPCRYRPEKCRRWSDSRLGQPSRIASSPRFRIQCERSLRWRKLGMFFPMATACFVISDGPPETLQYVNDFNMGRAMPMLSNSCGLRLGIIVRCNSSNCVSFFIAAIKTLLSFKYIVSTVRHRSWLDLLNVGKKNAKIISTEKTKGNL